MIQVKIENKVNGRSFGAIFDSQEEANLWIEKQQAKESWGKNEHDVIVDEKVAPNERAIFKENRSLTETFEAEGYEAVIDEESGEILYYEKLQYVYTIPCEYEVIVEEYIDANKNRNERDNILSKTDWLFVSDVPIASAHRLYYKNYRQMLRELDLGSVGQIETFESFLRRTQPQEFLDGGASEAIVAKFNYYL